MRFPVLTSNEARVRGRFLNGVGRTSHIITVQTRTELEVDLNSPCAASTVMKVKTISSSE